MDEEIERLMVSVRADTSAFGRDVAVLRQGLEGSLGEGAERAGARIENALGRAIRTGKLGFDDLRQVALATLSSIAAGAVSTGLGSIGGAGGLAGLASGLISSALGLPGRATGGPVAPGRGYLVGERGPEMFVPTASGRVEPLGVGGVREVRVAITVQGGETGGAQALAKSGRQVARAVRRALEAAEG